MTNPTQSTFPPITGAMLRETRDKAIHVIELLSRLMHSFPFKVSALETFMAACKEVESEAARLEQLLSSGGIRRLILKARPETNVIKCAEKYATCWHEYPVTAWRVLDWEFLNPFRSLYDDFSEGELCKRDFLRGVNHIERAVVCNGLGVSEAFFDTEYHRHPEARERIEAEILLEHEAALRHMPDAEAQSATAVDEWWTVTRASEHMITKYAQEDMFPTEICGVASSRISKACNKHYINCIGKGKDRRIEPRSFKQWVDSELKKDRRKELI